MFSGVMVAHLECGRSCAFEPRSGQTKDYKTGMCSFSAGSIKEKELIVVGSES